MSEEATFWSDRIVVEEIGGVPFKMYADRPRHIKQLLPFADHWDERPYIIQGERVLTFRGLRQASAAKARALVGSGVKPGQHVLILGWNSPDWVVNLWGCIQIGAVPVLGNAWWSEGDLAYALSLLQPVMVLADHRGASKMPSGWQLGRWQLDEESLSGPISEIPIEGAGAPNENSPAIIIFTSGTEGRAKAVVLSHRSFLASMLMMLKVTRQLPYTFNEKVGEICLHTGPLFHIGGPHILLRSVTVGNTLVFPSGRVEAAEVLALIERHRITRWTAVVPTVVNRFLSHADVERRDLSSLRAIGMGGAPVHAELLGRIHEKLPGVEARIAVGYGLSENAGQATAASGVSTAKRPGSAGRPLPLVEIRVDPREGLPDGEILVRSPTQMSGYYGTTTSPIDAAGWLHTGDLGRVDEDGLLWITGRTKDIIIRGGENIAPAAVEKALTTLPIVAEAAVIGVPHPDLGEEVMAFVVLKDKATIEQLQEQLRGNLPSFAMPSRWNLQTEPLPTNQTGKVDKPSLRARADVE